jgi:hypothetical protein
VCHNQQSHPKPAKKNCTPATATSACADCTDPLLLYIVCTFLWPLATLLPSCLQIPTPAPAPPNATRSERAEQLLQFASCVLRHSYHILQTTKELIHSGGNPRSINKGIEAAEMGMSVCSRKIAQAIIVMSSRADAAPQDAAPVQAAASAPAPGGDEEQQQPQPPAQQQQQRLVFHDDDDGETPILLHAFHVKALLQMILREHAGLRIPDEMRVMLREIRSMLEEDDDLRDTCSSWGSSTVQAPAV